MQERGRIISAIAVFIGSAVLLALLLVHAALYDFAFEVAPSPAVAFAASATPAGEYPARVSIPAIKVDAAVQALGVIAGDRMRAPTNYTDVGWFKYGVAPGAAGTAVLYAHLDNGLGLSGVFKDLNKVKKGDAVVVTTKGGGQLRFVVDEINTYPYNAVPLTALGEAPSADSSAHISLITCAGSAIYDPALGFTYDKRLVLRATYAEPRARW